MLQLNAQSRQRGARCGAEQEARGIRRRAAMIHFIRRYQSERGYAPSLREIGEAVGLSSSASVYHHLDRLRAEGRLRHERQQPRSWVPVEDRFHHLVAEFVRRWRTEPMVDDDVEEFVQEVEALL